MNGSSPPPTRQPCPQCCVCLQTLHPRNPHARRWLPACERCAMTHLSALRVATGGGVSPAAPATPPRRAPRGSRPSKGIARPVPRSLDAIELSATALAAGACATRAGHRRDGADIIDTARMLARHPACHPRPEAEDRAAMPVPETTVLQRYRGSTRLLDHLGARYAEVLREHRELVRAAIVNHAGRELGTLQPSAYGRGDRLEHRRDPQPPWALASSFSNLLRHRSLRVRVGAGDHEHVERDETNTSLQMKSDTQLTRSPCGRSGSARNRDARRPTFGDRSWSRFAAARPHPCQLFDVGEPRHVAQADGPVTGRVRTSGAPAWNRRSALRASR